ncbi:MAG: DNRLRE domain-containing protein [Pirellulales bacterium]
MATVCVILGSASAETITLRDGLSTAFDSTIRSNATNFDRNFGASNTTIVGKTTTPDTIRSVYGFDLSTIPAGATITGVSFRLIGDSADANSTGLTDTLELVRLNTAFTEGSGDGTGNSANDVTWNNRTTATPWGTAGGDLGTVLSSLTTSSDNFVAGQSLSFGASAAFISAIQSIADADGTFYFTIKGTAALEAQATRSIFFFRSAEFATAADRPQLTIDYAVAVPEPSVFLTAGAVGLVLAHVVRRRTFAA